MSLAQAGYAQQANWKAGAAKVRITPDKPLWMTGYGSRTHVSTGTIHELYARALALDDGTGKPAVLVTADILGFTSEVSKRIADEVQKKYSIPRAKLILSATHTHGGPAILQEHHMMYGVYATPAELRDLEQYARDLENKIVELVGSALKQMQPATLTLAHTQVAFAMNRRAKVATGYVISPNEKGPADHDVPVLLVKSNDGRILAVAFGYACHNTTVGGDCYEFHGDWAGFAQSNLEKQHEGAVALFVQGCGADANPQPRGTMDLARQHGQTMGDAVEKTISGSTKPIGGQLACAFRLVNLPFAPPPSREALQKQLEHKDIYFRWQARELLKDLDRDGSLRAQYPCPIQAWKFGDDLTLITIGGEVVVDYALRLKKELAGREVWVAGYCNDVFAYVPSRRVLEEGGYEAGGAMVYYVQPGPFTSSVEETLVGEIQKMLAGR